MGALAVQVVRQATEPEALLRSGLRELDQDETLAEPLLIYLAELVKWNQAYSLTAVRDPSEMVTRHLLDSLALLPQLAEPESLLDVGSGAGLPGVVLAIARPELRVDVLDSNGKKARFLRHAQRRLALENLTVVESRVENHRTARPYAAITSRAFASLAEFVAATAHLLADGGQWLAMKGRLDHNELAALPKTSYATRVVRLAVPGLREERHLVIATPIPTP